MKRLRLILTTLSLSIAICLMVFGVYATIDTKANITGSIQYTVDDAYVDIQTKVFKSSTYLDSDQIYDYVTELENGDFRTTPDGLSLQSWSPVYTSSPNETSNYKYGENDELDLSFNYYGENKAFAYFLVVNIVNKSSDINVWAIMDDTVYDYAPFDYDDDYDDEELAEMEIENTVQINTGAQPIIDQNGKNMVLALGLDDPSKEIGNKQFDYKINIGIGDLATQEFNLNKIEQFIDGESVVNTIGDEDTKGVVVIPESYDGTAITTVNFYDIYQINHLILPDTETSYIKNLRIGETKSISRFNIPSTMDELQNSSFEFCYNVKEILIPESIISLGNDTFNGCESLKRVVIPELVTSIGDSTFYGCYNLKEVTFSDDLENISDWAFGECYKLKSITIPESVTYIGPSAFAFCQGLEEINFNATNLEDSESDNWIFCDAGIDKEGIILNIGANVTRIPDYLFNPASEAETSPYITAVNFEQGSQCEEIGKFAFSYLNQLEHITLPDSLITIWGGAFEYCEDLTDIVFGENLINIEDGAFTGCSNLTNVTMNNSLESICDWAFGDCHKLSSITIPETVTYIGPSAFANCFELEEINFNATEMEDGEGDGWEFCNAGKDKNGIILNIGANVTRIPAYLFNPASDAESSPFITEVNFEQGSQCEEIGWEAFTYLNALEQITFPDSLITIGVSAFAYCEGLTDVVFGENLINIEDGAFNGCSNLTNVTMNNSLENICDWAFGDCHKLSSITIPETVTYIGVSSFTNCYELEEINFNATEMEDVEEDGWTFAYAGKDKNGIIVNIGANVTRIPGFLFNSASDTEVSPFITEIIFEENSKCETIGQHAFSYLNQLEQITLPDSVFTIEGFAFESCETLTEVNFGDNLDAIGEYAFNACTNLIEIILPNNLTTIGDYAFSWTGLETLNIPDEVTVLGDGAFYHCQSLHTVVIGNSVSVIEEYVFSDCIELTDLTFGTAVSQIKTGFSSCDELNSIIINATTPPAISEKSSILISAKIYIPKGTLTNYQSVWGTEFDFTEFE